MSINYTDLFPVPKFVDTYNGWYYTIKLSCPFCGAGIRNRAIDLHNIVFVNEYPMPCQGQGDKELILKRDIILGEYISSDNIEKRRPFLTLSEYIKIIEK